MGPPLLLQGPWLDLFLLLLLLLLPQLPLLPLRLALPLLVRLLPLPLQEAVLEVQNWGCGYREDQRQEAHGTQPGVRPALPGCWHWQVAGQAKQLAGQRQHCSRKQGIVEPLRNVVRFHVNRTGNKARLHNRHL